MDMSLTYRIRLRHFRHYSFEYRRRQDVSLSIDHLRTKIELLFWYFVA